MPIVFDFWPFDTLKPIVEKISIIWFLTIEMGDETPWLQVQQIELSRQTPLLSSLLSSASWIAFTLSSAEVLTSWLLVQILFLFVRNVLNSAKTAFKSPYFLKKILNASNSAASWVEKLVLHQYILLSYLSFSSNCVNLQNLFQL
jgi:hypothetical protein